LILDLNFSGDNTRYATHGLHSYAAKCPPQLVKYGLDAFSKPGDIVLDPMVGSGTTLVESKIQGRNAIGIDLDPLACLIARVKSRVLDDEQIEHASARILKSVTKDIKIIQGSRRYRALSARSAPPDFPNRDYWFSKPVQQDLALLSYQIHHACIEDAVREFLWVAYSGIILTKVSVANARDIIHSRHHYTTHPEPPNVLDRFERRVKMMRRQMDEFRQLCGKSKATIAVEQGDARRLSLGDNSVDFIFTSPPYATALDYPRALFMAVNWMQPVLDITHDEYKKGGKDYIGSERGILGMFRLDDEITGLAKTTIARLAELDPRRAGLVQRYFVDMKKVLYEMSRVLKTGRYATIVVCPSHIRKIDVPTHKVFTEIATVVGLYLVEEHIRGIDSGKRLLPHVRGKFGNRMTTEYVLVYQKG
jgi:hypothetical protein